LQTIAALGGRIDRAREPEPGLLVVWRKLDCAAQKIVGAGSIVGLEGMHALLCQKLDLAGRRRRHLRDLRAVRLERRFASLARAHDRDDTIGTEPDWHNGTGRSIRSMID